MSYNGGCQYIANQVGPTKLSQLDLTASHIPQIVEKATSVHDIDVSPYKITADMLTKAIQYMESLD